MIPQRSNWYAEIAIALLVLALVILSVFLVRQYRITAREGAVSAEKIRFADLLHHRSLGGNDVSLIEPWMTFDYVSISFKVPSAYLMTALSIASSTPKYPNVTIGRYARTIATSSTAFTAFVRAAVQSYLAPAPIPAPAAATTTVPLPTAK